MTCSTACCVRNAQGKGTPVRTVTLTQEALVEGRQGQVLQLGEEAWWSVQALPQFDLFPARPG